MWSVADRRGSEWLLRSASERTVFCRECCVTGNEFVVSRGLKCRQRRSLRYLAWALCGVLCVQVLCFPGAASLWAFEEPVVTGWQPDFEAAEKRAAAEQLPMLIHFGANWCGPCRQMERSVLGTAQVREALSEGIVGVKVDSDKRRDLMKRFGISVLPTDLVIAPDGKVMLRQSGSKDLRSYNELIRRHRKSGVAPMAGDMPGRAGTAGAG